MCGRPMEKLSKWSARGFDDEQAELTDTFAGRASVLP